MKTILAINVLVALAGASWVQAAERPPVYMFCVQTGYFTRSCFFGGKSPGGTIVHIHSEVKGDLTSPR